MRTLVVSVGWMMLGVGCGLFQPAVVVRPAGQDCTRYEWTVRRAQIAGGWGEPEFVGMTSRTGAGGYEYFGQYAACPVDAPADSALLTLWRYWRRQQLAGFYRYDDNVGAAEPPDALAVTAGAPATTEPVEGVLYRIESYHAFFPGCSYWATEQQVSAAFSCEEPARR